MKIVRRISALAMAALCVCALFAGCGGKNSGEEGALAEYQGSALAEMSLSDLREYFVAAGLIQPNGQMGSTGDLIGSVSSLVAVEEQVYMYWFDLENLDDEKQVQYDTCKKKGRITVEYSDGSSGTVELTVNGPFAVSASLADNEKEIIKAFKALN